MAKQSRKRPASDVEEASLEKPAAAGGGASSPSETESPSTKKNEVRFGRHLASSDKRVRDRTVSALREWLFHRSKGGALTDLDLLKIWRGLWYCMFMCDKAPVQTELAQNLTSLMDLFKEEKMEGVRFFRSFCITMQRDWERIDNLRIDKYYTLVRLFVRKAVSFCRVRRRHSSSPPQVQAGDSQKKHAKKKKKSQSPATGAASAGRLADRDTAASRDDEEARDGWEWDLDLLRAVVAVVEEEILTVRMAPIGLRLHVADVWIEEICTAGGEDMPTEAFLVVLAPWLRVAAAPLTDSVVFKRTYERVFQELLACFPQGDEENEEGKRVFKKVDLVRVQACLFEVAAAPQTREKRRTSLYKLHRKYQKVTGAAPDANAPPSGILPSPSKETSDSEEDGSEFVEAGARPRAVRGPEPPVAGWAAAGIAAGDIAASGEEGIETARTKKGGKLGKKSGEEDQAEPSSGNDKGGKGSSGGVVEREGDKEEGENGVRESKRTKKRSRKEEELAEGDQEEAFVDGTKEEDSREESAGSGSKKKKKKKMKKKSQKNKTEAEAPSVAAQEESDEGGRETATSIAVAGVHSPELGMDDAPVSSKKKASKKGKIVSKSPPRAGTPEKSLDGGERDGDGEAVHPAARSEHDGGSNGTSPVPAKSPPPSSAPASAPPASERKKKKKRRRDSQGDHEEGGDDDVTAVAVADPTESVAVEGGASASQVTGRKKMKAEKAGRKGQAMEEDRVEAALLAAPSSSASDEGEASMGTPTQQQQQSGKKKKKKKSTSPGTESIPSPASADASLMSPPVRSFRTPPKTSNGSTPNNTPGKSGSAKKTVTFGTNTVKEHKASVKDLKSRVITPSKDSGTPQKGLLKVAEDSETKPRRSSVGRKGTPALRSKRATDFF